jgi:signal transduction histidine kinase
MSRVPIRLRLAIAFGVATLVVLAGAGLFVYVRLDSDLTETIDESLDRAAAELQAAAAEGDGARAGAPAEADEGFAQVYDAEGTLARSSPAGASVALTDAELARAEREEFYLEREVEGVEGDARMLAGPIADPGAAGAVVFAVGRSTEDRDDTLGDLVAAFAVGAPLAVVLASLIGVALARSALGPMESIRSRAELVSLEPGDPLLPLPRARDEVRRLAETLNDMLERLRGAFERERRFVADAAHELRTPIAVIRAELDAGLRSPDAGPLARDSFGQALGECDRLAALAEDLLVLARAEDGALPVRRERLDARDALEATQVRFAERATSAGRSIRVDAPPGLALSADPLRLRQALGNLVDNALRHGSGEVVLRASAEAPWVDLEVSDHGDGFAAGIEANAFERFSRGDDARTRGGAGLGLAIVQTIARAHGGSAAIVDPEHAAVRIRLPAGSQEAFSLGA